MEGKKEREEKKKGREKKRGISEELIMMGKGSRIELMKKEE